MLNRWFETLDGLADEHGVYKLETIGDAFLAATNLLAPQPDHAARMARFALAATAAAERTLVDETDPARRTLQIRAGINSGPCMAAVIGRRNPKYAEFIFPFSAPSLHPSLKLPPSFLLPRPLPLLCFLPFRLPLPRPLPIAARPPSLPIVPSLNLYLLNI
jgi:hypothetical protein